MYSYSFYNNNKIKKEALINKIVNLYNLDLIDNTETNIVMGNREILIDISKKYIIIILYNENFNITKLTDYILRITDE